MILVSFGLGIILGYFWGFLVALRANRKYNNLDTKVDDEDRVVGTNRYNQPVQTNNVTSIKKN